MRATGRRMLLIVCSLSLVDGGTGLAGETAASAATEALRVEEIGLQRIDAKDAVTILRAIAGLREIEVVDARTVRIQSPPEKLLVARKVLELAEGARGSDLEVARYEVGDGTHVAAVALRHASGNEVMGALRTLGIARIAVLDEPPTVVVRDSAEQVQAALQAILARDRTAP